ncbi:nuclear transport factor 2 family protein [Streptomyces brasiliensis]|uniref:SnoaL-like domain-containing protein n=1 Tax=Streptomyces brasiliensis TaxID=1954 RepID=A0A917UIB4_9ACTN|nr:nuclear transport factor 2 family protein [Streptomyces brasiliensis]GGJ60473.1 hypothetical protein GCM10010121_083850 [Streptomyces brasiliensis]
MSAHEIQTRLDAIESRIAIERLISEYAYAFDGHDVEMLRGIWHEGALLALGEPFGDFSGIEGIVAAAHLLWAQSPHMHHWMSNILIDIDSDEATATSALDCLVANVESGPTQVGGVYRDRFERRNGRWGIVERRFELHYFTPLPGWKPIHGTEVPFSVSA